jgi:hypothetical protein
VTTAANKIAAVEELSGVFLNLMQRRADVGEQLSIEKRATVRGQCGYVIQLLKEAVEALHNISGASSI